MSESSPGTFDVALWLTASASVLIAETSISAPVDADESNNRCASLLQALRSALAHGRRPSCRSESVSFVRAFCRAGKTTSMPLDGPIAVPACAHPLRRNNRLTAAQRADRARRIGVLSIEGESGSQSMNPIGPFLQALLDLGWNDGRNIRVDARHFGGDPTRADRLAKDLIELKPDVLLARGTLAATALRQYTLSIPIIFVYVPDRPSKRQYYRLYKFRVLNWREVAAPAQRVHTLAFAGGSPF